MRSITQENCVVKTNIEIETFYHKDTDPLYVCMSRKGPFIENGMLDFVEDYLVDVNFH